MDADIIISKIKALISEDLEIDDTTPLLEEGYLDSIKLVNLIVLIEELRLQQIPDELLLPENFANIKTIIKKFF